MVMKKTGVPLNVKGPVKVQKLKENTSDIDISYCSVILADSYHHR